MLLRANKFKQEADLTKTLADIENIYARIMDEAYMQEIYERHAVDNPRAVTGKYASSLAAAADLITFHYLRGDELSAMQPLHEQVLVSAERVANVAEEFAFDSVVVGRLLYPCINSPFFPLAIVLQVDRTVLQQFVAQLPACVEGKTRFQDRLLQTLIPQRALAEHYTGPDRKRWAAIIEAPPEKRPTLVKKHWINGVPTLKNRSRCI
ncbi:hypothetical protein [Aliamphritea spongicola]|nr:hypothetical protein [Aliamphritea spongicola]